MAHDLKLFNSLTGSKDVFVPMDDQSVKMYVCGPTLYAPLHVGNLRPMIVFDLLYRILRELYGIDQVIYARNITDYDQKVMTAVNNSSLDFSTFMSSQIQEFNAYETLLGLIPPDFEPRVTKYVTSIRTYINKLTEKGKTYEIDGIIYLRNRAFNVGMLSRKPYVDLTHNRIEPDPNKEDPRDFILWKPIPNDYEFGFEYPESSPLHSTEAKGQPGWHIECSAMAEEVLGSKIDIHGGGEDLMFPHHENEISQCYARHGHFMSKFWLHNGFVTNSKGQKFGKSLDNAITVNEALNKFGGEVIRFYMLMTHYRSPKTWSLEGLVEAQTIFMKFQNLTHGVFHPYNKPPTEFWDALMNDMNTPLAIAKMHEYAKKDIFSLDICMRWLGF